MRYRSEINAFLLPAALVFILFWLNSTYVLSQAPQDFFVGGANLYINGETERAREYIESGLAKYPDDKKLQALKKAIEEEKKDKDQNQDKNKDQDQQKKENDQQQDKQQKEEYISKEDAQRLLDALANDEKNVQEKVKEAKAAKARVRTLINW